MSSLDSIRIAKNDSYELTVSTTKNYFIISYYGIWDDTCQLDNYTKDIERAIKELSKGFNLLIILSQYRGSSTKYTNLHIDSLKSCVDAGLNKVGVVLYGNPLLKISIDYILKLCEIRPTYFNNSSSAEVWIGM